MKVKIITLMVLLSLLLSSVPYSLLITSEGEQVAPPNQVILPGEEITIDKKVYDPSKGEYVEYAKFGMGTESIQFRCTCTGPRVSEMEQLMGDFSIVIIDKLPANLIYGGYSNYEAKYDENENTITWELSAEDLKGVTDLSLYFNAKPVALGIGINEIIVKVQSAKGVYTFNDTATVEIVSGGGGEIELGYADKKVLDREGNWVEETRVMVGDRVTFRCSVYLTEMPASLSHPDDSGYKIVYYPPFSRGAEGYLMDKLPSNLRYVEESANIPPSFYDEANNTLYWYMEDIHTYMNNNYKIDLPNNTMIPPGMDAIYFDAEAVAPGKGVNVFSGEINASCDVMVDGGRPETKGETFTFEDTATVWVIEGNEPPTCRLIACPISGYAPLKVFFHIDAEDPDGYIVNWSLDVDSDGIPEFSGQDLPSEDLVYIYNEPGLYIAKLIVEDDDGAVGTDTAEIQVLQETEENQPPSCRLRVEPSSGYVPLNVTFQIEAMDPDGEIVEWSLDVDDDGTPERSGSGSPPSTIEYTYESPGIYTARLTVVDDDGAIKDTTFVVNVFEVSPALTFINITRPVECTLYFMDREIIPLIFFTVSIGPLTIDVNASDDVTRVEFFVDNESKYIDDTPPFSWKWNETPLLGFHTIKVVGYGKEIVTDEIDIIAINLRILERLSGRGEGVKVYGKVCDSSKILFSGIRGARVTAYYLNESGEPAEIADKDVTGFFLFRRGRYSLNLEANKTYLIKVEARGYESAEKIISTYTENRSIRLDFYLNKTILVKGKVTTKSFIFKRPIRGANVTIIKDGEIIANLTTNIFGRFKVWLTPGNYTFIISAPGYEVLSENITLRPTLTGKKILRFRLSREVSE